MEQGLKCDTVKDLLPIYVDGMTSEESNKLVEEHIKDCNECRLVLEQMKEPVKVDTAPEVKEFKKYLKKSRLSIFYWIMGASAFIALAACFIVNLAVEKGLSWFYIVAAGIVTAYLPVYVGISANKNRFTKALAVLNGCTLLLLGVIQLVVYYYLGIGDIWFWSIGLPIALLWSAIVWASIGCCRLLNLNVVLSISVLVWLAVPANYFTNLIGGSINGLDDYFNSFVSNGLGNVLAAFCLLAAGIVVQVRKRKQKASGRIED